MQSRAWILRCHDRWCQLSIRSQCAYSSLPASSSVDRLRSARIVAVLWPLCPCTTQRLSLKGLIMCSIASHHRQQEGSSQEDGHRWQRNDPRFVVCQPYKYKSIEGLCVPYPLTMLMGTVVLAMRQLRCQTEWHNVEHSSTEYIQS